MHSCVMTSRSSSGSSYMRRSSTTSTSCAGESVVLSVSGECERSCVSSRPRYFLTVAVVVSWRLASSYMES